MASYPTGVRNLVNLLNGVQSSNQKCLPVRNSFDTERSHLKINIL